MAVCQLYSWYDDTMLTKKNPLGNTVACPGIGIAMLVVFWPIPGQKIQKMSRRDNNIVDE